jgi:hypothetical protein
MENNKASVFVFCRPYLIPDFKENVAPLVDDFDFQFLTDGRNRFGVTDTRKRFYERLETATTPTGFSAEDELDVVERCRYLRNLPRKQALRMLRAMASVLEEELELYKPNVVLAQMVDEYITHLLSEIARRRGIVYAGYIYSYFPGRAQVVLFSEGRPLKIRDPSDMEIRETWAEVSPNTFRQNYKQRREYSRTQHLKAMLRYKVKQMAFNFLAWRDDDPLNLHYRCLPYVVERRRWRDFPSEDDFHQDWRILIETSKNNLAMPIVYFPLAYFPESSTDYWISNREVLDYQNLTLKIFKSLSETFTVIAKEHMHMLGGRNPEYYREIKQINGLISIPPSINSNDVLSISDAVILGGGSVGIESFLRGTPILTFCNTSCWFSASGATELDLSDISSWAARIIETIRMFETPSDIQQCQFLKRCLQGTMRTKKSGKYWPICNTDDLRCLLSIAMTNDAPVTGARISKETLNK